MVDYWAGVEAAYDLPGRSDMDVLDINVCTTGTILDLICTIAHINDKNYECDITASS